jgi:hypothetical protein
VPLRLGAAAGQHRSTDVAFLADHALWTAVTCLI